MAKVLIADDDEKLRLLIRTTLVDAGHTVLHASDGVETLRLVRAEKPDLVLLDIIMPKMQGFEVCKAIRSDADGEIAKIKIVIISVKNYTVDKRAAEQLGVNAYLVKPFSQKDLKDAVWKLLHP